MSQPTISTSDLRDMLLELAKEYKATVIMTTHNLEEVQKMCDTISILKNGKNVFTSKMDTLKDSSNYMEHGQFSLERLYMEVERMGVKQ